tara:strand:+ start:254 stop:454 length:201 start_codon:yes stop_codon:yes gene_type:complete
VKTKHLDDIANKYNETKDPYYKNLWYKKVKEFANGADYFKRRTVSIDTSDETTDGWHRVIEQPKLF